MIQWIRLVCLSIVLLGCGAQTVPDSNFGQLAVLGQVDPRFQSYNVEMVEVTGGRFWAPYGGPAGEVYRFREPEDLTNQRLRHLAKHLGPAYMRVSGTWANFTYLEAEGEQLEEAPEGYGQILTRDQWRGVLDFADAVDAEVGISFAVSDGTRDEQGVWLTEQAQRLVELTESYAGRIAFAEFINEPNAAAMGRLPEGYSIADYTRDFAIFLEWARANTPDTLIVGPGGVGEGNLEKEQIPAAFLGKLLLTAELMAQSPNTVDAMSYHFYGDVSERCANIRPKTADKSLVFAPEWLDKTLNDYRYYAGLRDQFEPGDPMWITETAQAACGGSPWAAHFLDTFRYLNQLGLLAQQGVQVVFHNTLAASDYALIDQDTHNPRPNYWGAVLWQQLMGEQVLASPAQATETLRLYAHCQKAATEGAVAVLAINTAPEPAQLTVPDHSRLWLMTSNNPDSAEVMVNGGRPEVDANGLLRGLEGEAVSGEVVMPPHTIGFISVEAAGHPQCR